MPHSFTVYHKNEDSVYEEYQQEIPDIYSFVGTIEQIRKHYKTPLDDIETALYYLERATLRFVKIDPATMSLFKISKRMSNKKIVYWGKYDTLAYDAVAHPEDGIDEPSSLPGLPTGDEITVETTPLTEPFPQPAKCRCCSHVKPDDSASTIIQDAANF
ncbi:hypothetical protein LPJ53_001729 [Coemansia erecta]|uniref:Uncharacterized protein n=1 Tax=Coemansia erecta TaxID=147472 RepID=A0A9W8CU88_9FUNG|nr:hypothetical protein LPJ53_001729 [Coemansia erecta]